MKGQQQCPGDVALGKAQRGMARHSLVWSRPSVREHGRTVFAGKDIWFMLTFQQLVFILKYVTRPWAAFKVSRTLVLEIFSEKITQEYVRFFG